MTEIESRWKKEARGLFFLLVILTAIPLALAAYFDIQAHKSGADAPTVEKPVENIRHARKKYISAAEAERIRLLWTIFLIGFPSSILFGVVLRFVFNLNIFKHEPMPVWVDNLMNKVKENQL